MPVALTGRCRLKGRNVHVGLLALLVAWPLSALSLGLGEPQVKSHLGDRLRVQIPLILDSGERADEVKVRLASPADRERFGASVDEAAVRMRLSVETSGRDGPSISVTSAGGVNEPMLSFVIEAQSDSNRFMREYTVLLDPIDYRTAPRATSDRTRSGVPTKSAVERPTSASAPVIDGDRYGPVAPGDTLSELGARLRPDRSVSVSQMSMALFLANPQAFTGNDVNRLISGASLRVPNRDEAIAMSAQAARERLYGRAPSSSPRVVAAAPAIPSAMPEKPPVRAQEPPLKTAEETAESESETSPSDTAPTGDQALREPEYRLSIVAGDRASESTVEEIISGVSGSTDVDVLNLVERLQSARQKGDEPDSQEPGFARANRGGGCSDCRPRGRVART